MPRPMVYGEPGPGGSEQPAADQASLSQQTPPNNEPQVPRGNPAPPQGVSLAPAPRDTDVAPAPDTDEDLLFGQPGNATAADVIRSARGDVERSRNAPVSTRLVRLLPYLKQLAEDPSTPPGLRAFYFATVNNIDARMRANATRK